MHIKPQLTAEMLAARLTPKPTPRKNLVARLTLCAALAGGAVVIAPAPQAWAASETDSPNTAYQNGFTDAINSFNAHGGVPSVTVSPYDDPALSAAYFEGIEDGFACATTGECGDDGDCSTCGCGCGCGCGG